MQSGGCSIAGEFLDASHCQSPIKKSLPPSCFEVGISRGFLPKKLSPFYWARCNRATVAAS